MTKAFLGAHPSMLGFEQLDRLIEQSARNDGYPPYNITQHGPDEFRITLAVAGFSDAELEVTLADSQLVIHGAKTADDHAGRVYLHRGIAARQFQRSFVLAAGVHVTGSYLADGLLHIALKREHARPAAETIAVRKSGVGK